MNKLDHIRLGLAAKTAWPDIDFGAIEIIEVPFGKTSFEAEGLVDKLKFYWGSGIEPPPLTRNETVDMRRWRSGETEFMMGCTSSFDRLLVGIKE